VIFHLLQEMIFPYAQWKDMSPVSSMEMEDEFSSNFPQVNNGASKVQHYQCIVNHPQ